MEQIITAKTLEKIPTSDNKTLIWKSKKSLLP